MTEADDKKPMLRTTALGTAIRQEWTNGYYKLVVGAEQEMRRGICGAPKKDETPCKGQPQKKHGYYCRLHRYTGKLQLTSQEAKHPVKVTKQPPPVLFNDEIRNGLARCNICPVRNRCEMNLPGHFCRIEERIVHQFLNTAKEDYEVDPLDEFSLVAAALSYINIIRARINQAGMTPRDAEQDRLSWYAPRDQKEFIRLMKELGLTRKERLEQEAKRAAIGRPGLMAGGASLAQVMSELQQAKQIEISQTVTIKKKDNDHVIDVEGEVIEDDE